LATKQQRKAHWGMTMATQCNTHCLWEQHTAKHKTKDNTLNTFTAKAASLLLNNLYVSFAMLTTVYCDVLEDSLRMESVDGGACSLVGWLNSPMYRRWGKGGYVRLVSLLT